MLDFVDFSTTDQVQFLVQDDDVFYKWVPRSVEPIHEWLKKKDEYKFKVKYSENYTIASITVYRGEECLLCEKIDQVKWL